MKIAITLLAVFTLMVPQAQATASPIMVKMCGSGLRMALPTRLPMPGKNVDDDCCKKGCHAANDRKKRLIGQAGDADDDEGCCA